MSDPLLQLAETARLVSHNHDYSTRAVKRSRDELGELVDCLNEMLAGIQERDAALATARDTLEACVEQRTQELVRSVSLLHATLESTADAILVVDPGGRISSYNTKFAQMWGVPAKLNGADNQTSFLGFLSGQLKDGERFACSFNAASEDLGSDVLDTLEFKDGRVLERYSQGRLDADKSIGRVWCFRDVTERKRAEFKLEQTHHELVDASRLAGMAEVATNVLHNVGNVLNSVNVSANVAIDELKRSKTSGVAKAAQLLAENQQDLPRFFTEDKRGLLLLKYLESLGQDLLSERTVIMTELQGLLKNIEHIKTIVSMQQDYARVSGVLEPQSVAALVEDALRIHANTLAQHRIQVLRQFDPVPEVVTDKHQVMQILVNLISNAYHAIDQSDNELRQISIHVRRSAEDILSVCVKDTGVGIAAENLTRIFNHGFTTRKNGHGFGLHSGALAVKELGGSLIVQSEGRGKGAVFTLALPIKRSR